MQLTLTSTRPETSSTTTLFFEKPSGFTYLPGQFLNVTVQVENCDARCNNRNFSLSSSPTEDHLTITTRHGISRFKQTIETAQPGFTIDVKGPLGKFVLNEDPNLETVMITGGIGITPFHSMIKYATDKQLAKKITLLYSNKTSNDIPFKNELDALDAKNPNLKIHYTITQPDEKWPGKTGRINDIMIKELIPNWQSVEFFSVGPALMVLDLKKQLKAMGIEDSHIHTELFTGY